MNHLALVAGALVLGGCAALNGGPAPNGGPAGHLDGLAAMRCAEAQRTIVRLRDTAALYQVDDLAARMHRASRLAEIWCPEPVPGDGRNADERVLPSGGEPVMPDN